MVDGERFQLCLTCSRKEHVPLQSTPKQIKKRSDKKIIEDRIYAVLRNKYLTANEECEMKFPGCTNKSTEIHHQKGRGINTNNDTTFIATCRNCHTHCHLNPTSARELGFLD